MSAFQAAESVSVTGYNALNGLYLTPDMYVTAGWIVRDELVDISRALHATQPKTADFDKFSNVVSDRYLDWVGDARVAKTLGEVRLGQIILMTQDLAMTYRYIRRSIAAAADLVLSIYQRTNGVVDDSEYVRLVPAALEDVHIRTVSDVSDDVLHRIFALEPWRSSLQRLAAQKQRSDVVLRLGDDLSLYTSLKLGKIAEHCYTEVGTRAEQRRSRQRALTVRRSIRKSLRMFDRLGRADILHDFLRSDLRLGSSPLILSGKRYDYHLSHKGDIVETTKNYNNMLAPAHTVIYNKAGQRLCEVCLFFKDTPVLDYVLGLDRMVRNEETELDILQAACVIDAPRDFYRDPILPALKGLEDPIEAPMLAVNIFRHVDHLPEEQRRAAMPIYHAALSHGFRIFRQITRPPRRYLALLRQTGLHDVTDYWTGPKHPAGQLLQAVQRAQAAGDY